MKKRIIACILLILGIGVIGYGLHAKGEVSDARKGLDTLTNPIANDLFGKTLKGVGENKLQGYDKQIAICLSVGIFLALLGGGVFFIPSKGKKS